MIMSGYWKCGCDLVLHPGSVKICPVCNTKYHEDRLATPEEIKGALGN